MDEFARLLEAHKSGKDPSSASGKPTHNNNKNSRWRDNRSKRRDDADRGSKRDRPQEGFRHAWKDEELEKVRGKYLVVIPAGDASLHDDSEAPWHGSAAYDLVIVYYGSDSEKAERFKSHAKAFFEKKGPKWQLVRHVLLNFDWEKYELIWLPDDDLKVDAKDIHRMFRLASEYKLLLSQPALHDKNVQPQYRHIIVKREGIRLHYTNFVEIMCPLFRVDALKHVFSATIDEDECKSGWGLDMLWPQMLNFYNIGVIDATPVLHTRPQNAFSVDSSFYKMYNIDPQREYYDLSKKHRFRDFRRRAYSEVKDVEPTVGSSTSREEKEAKKKTKIDDADGDGVA